MPSSLSPGASDRLELIGGRAWPRLEVSAVARARVEDFEVEEQVCYELEGAGPHVWLRVEKRDANTAWVAGELGAMAGVGPVDVGYAGLKDRRAVTTQWFSVHLPRLGAEEIPDWVARAHPSFRVLEAVKHRKKLRRGGLIGNRFRITLRELSGGLDGLGARAELISRQGVPNYFGLQRFGHQGGNVTQAVAMFSGARRPRGRHRRGLYLSAARGFLFNRVLAARVEQGTWNQLLDGDALVADRGQRAFAARNAREAEDGTLTERLQSLALHPTGPLWGSGRSPAVGSAAELEEAALMSEARLRQGLEAAGLHHERRALRLRVESLALEFGEDRTATVSFALGKGAYATMVLRELIGG